MKEDLLLSVIIVNYNGKRFLKKCFESLAENLKHVPFEIIVIDNCSTDDSCAYVTTNFPKVILIASQINHGFGKGNNEAVKYAKGEYLLLINNDTVVLDDLSPVLDALKNDSKIGVAAIRMLNGDGDYLPSAGVFPNVSNMFRMSMLWDRRIAFQTGNFDEAAYDVDWLSGSFLMMPKKTYMELQGFDEAYFMYVEDVDLCKRVADAGYKRVFLPQLRYIHYVGFNKSRNLLLVKGYKIYIQKNLHGLHKTFISAALRINELVKIVKLNLIKD